MNNIEVKLPSQLEIFDNTNMSKGIGIIFPVMLEEEPVGHLLLHRNKYDQIDYLSYQCLKCFRHIDNLSTVQTQNVHKIAQAGYDHKCIRNWS